MIGEGGSDFEHLSDDVMIRVNRLCNDFEERWRAGEQPTVEEVLDGVEDTLRQTLLSELLPLEIAYRRRSGMAVSIDQYIQRFPSVAQDWVAALVQDTHDRGSAEIPAKLGDYTIVRQIGSGGMGTVYQAYHERMGRTVAIKVLRPELAVQPQTMQRFVREIRAVAKLSHPNIVAAYDSREENGIAYLVTEFVDGMNLGSLVKQRGPLPCAEAVQYVLQAAFGLQYAHEQGIVHRDIKPANLIVAGLRDPDDPDDTQRHEVGGEQFDEELTLTSLQPVRVKILDLGLARLDTAEESELTKTDMVMGTAAYMAPEQAMRPKEVDYRVDIYSLGCTLYYLLTGRPVYTGDSVFETILAHANQPIPTLADLRPDVAAVLDPILSRMLAKDPADRFESMDEVIAELNGVANIFEISARSHQPANSSRTAGPTQPIVTGGVPLENPAGGAKACAPSNLRGILTRRNIQAIGGILIILALTQATFLLL